MMHCSKFTEYAVECYIGAFSVVRMDAAEICAGGEDFLAVLDFINKHIAPSTVFFDFIFNVGEKFNGVLQRFETGVLKVNFDYLVFFNPAFYKMLFEDFEKEITLSASPYPGDDFHEVIMFSVDYAFEKKVTFDCHDIFPVYKSLDLSKNLKALALYHMCFSTTSRALINLWIFPINYKRSVKRSCFELGNGKGKQQGQLETTT